MSTAPSLIVVIDDDDACRAAIVGLARAMGYRTAAFGSGDAFLSSDAPTHTRCLLVDAHMPGMGGLDLHRRVIALGHRIPTIMMTAAPFDADRRNALESGLLAYHRKPVTGEGLLSLLALLSPISRQGHPIMPTVVTKDGTEIYYKDWGSGQPVLFSHGWPLNSDAWEAQMLFVAEHGYRAIAHDRRGHGRSSQPWGGNTMDTYADDLATLIEALDLRDLVLVGHSTGGGEITRYMGRHGTDRVAKAVLVGAVPPLMLQTPANPDGLPIDVFDGIRDASIKDRSQLYRDLATGPFFGFNRAGATVSQGMADAFWLQGMMSGHKNAFDCIKAFSETDFTEDLKRIGVPTLILHGDDDQVVPIKASAHAAARLLPNATLKVFPGGSHGLPQTSGAEISADLLAFLRS